MTISVFSILIALLIATFFVAIISLLLNGSWRAIKRAVNLREKIDLQPDAFIATLRLYRPKTLHVHKIWDNARISDIIAYRMFFDTEINRAPVRFITLFGSSIVPDFGTRTIMSMDLLDHGRSADWDALSSTTRALVRLLDNTGLHGANGIATVFRDSYDIGRVTDPAIISTTTIITGKTPKRSAKTQAPPQVV